MPEPTRTLAGIIGDSLAASGLSQARLATAIGVSDSTLSRLLTGGPAALTVVVRIADHFGWSDNLRREALDIAVADRMPPRPAGDSGGPLS